VTEPSPIGSESRHAVKSRSEERAAPCGR
jgi:hypothetical protein